MLVSICTHDLGRSSFAMLLWCMRVVSIISSARRTFDSCCRAIYYSLHLSMAVLLNSSSSLIVTKMHRDEVVDKLIIDVMVLFLLAIL